VKLEEGTLSGEVDGVSDGLAGAEEGEYILNQGLQF
jgi:hypothetical protein